jgi:hypothetical protein
MISATGRYRPDPPIAPAAGKKCFCFIADTAILWQDFD